MLVKNDELLRVVYVALFLCLVPMARAVQAPFLESDACRYDRACFSGASTSTLLQLLVEEACDRSEYSEVPSLVARLSDWNSSASHSWAIATELDTQLEDRLSSYAMAALVIRGLHRDESVRQIRELGILSESMDKWINEVTKVVGPRSHMSAMPSPDPSLLTFELVFEARLDQTKLTELKDLLTTTFVQRNDRGMRERKTSAGLPLLLHGYINQTADIDMLRALWERDVYAQLQVLTILRKTRGFANPLNAFGLELARSLAKELPGVGATSSPGPDRLVETLRASRYHHMMRFLQHAAVEKDVAKYMCELVREGCGAYRNYRFYFLHALARTCCVNKQFRDDYVWQLVQSEMRSIRHIANALRHIETE